MISITDFNPAQDEISLEILPAYFLNINYTGIDSQVYKIDSFGNSELALIAEGVEISIADINLVYSHRQ